MATIDKTASATSRDTVDRLGTPLPTVTPPTPKPAIMRALPWLIFAVLFTLVFLAPLALSITNKQPFLEWYTAQPLVSIKLGVYLVVLLALLVPALRSAIRPYAIAVLLVAGIDAYVYGWFKAEIAPAVLVEKRGELGRRFGELLQPDVIAQDQKQLQISLPIVGVDTAPSNITPGKVESAVNPVIKKGGDANHIITPESGAAETFNIVITTSTDKVTPGQKITVTGTGLRSDTGGQILWTSTGTGAFTQAIGSYKTDLKGNFTSEVAVPAEADRVMNSFGFPNTLSVSQTWGYGGLYPSDTFSLVVDKIIETIFLALMATTFAIFISLPLSFFAARNLMPHNFWGTAIYSITRTILNILRSIESLILAIIFAATVGLGPFAGMLALGVYAIASLGKFYSESIEAIDPGPVEAITATGANRVQMITYAVIPQFIPQFIAFTLYMWDRSVRASTVIGLVGGGGIGFILIQFINLGDYHKAATAIWAIAIVVIAMDWASAKIRAKVI